MTVPYPVVRKLVLLSVMGYVVLTIGVVSGAAWWQYRTDSKQEQIIEAVITAQEERVVHAGQHCAAAAP